MISIDELRNSAAEIVAGIALAATILWRARLKVKADNRDERALHAAEDTYRATIDQLSATVERMAKQIVAMDQRITEEMNRRYAVELEADRLRRRVAALESQLGVPGAA